RRPAERDRRRARLGPAPVDACGQLVDDAADLRLVAVLAVEERLRVQRPAQQQRGVDGRQLAIAGTQAGVHLEEVIEEPAVTGHALGARALRQIAQEAQRQQRARARLLARHIAALDADAVGRQRETDRRDAARARLRPAVRREAVGAAAGFPEEA